MDFSGKTVLVTGAAGAIGRGIAAGFSSSGAPVFVTDIDAKGLDATAKEITSSGGRCEGLPADVTKAGQVKAVVSAASKAFGGKTDILVNVAGIIGSCPVEDMTEEVWDNMFAVNCKGTFLFTK